MEDDARSFFEEVAELALEGRTPRSVAREERLAWIERLTPAEAGEIVRRAIGGTFVQSALEWLRQVGFWARWIPELEATVNFSQEAGRRHKDVWAHTKQVVEQAVSRPAVRWAALLHDVGKVPTRTFTAEGGVHFHRHAEVGARMFDEIARRFGLEKPLRQAVRFLILHHLRANQYDGTWTDSAVRRFDREMGSHLEDLLDLSRADITSKRPGKRQTALGLIAALAERIENIRRDDAVLPLLPSGIGNAIMERFGLPPSRRIGELKVALEAAVEAGELEPREAPEYYLEHVAKLLGETPGARSKC